MFTNSIKYSVLAVEVSIGLKLTIICAYIPPQQKFTLELNIF